MKKPVKIALVTALLLTVVGAVVAALGFWGMNFQFRGLNTQAVTTTTFETTEPFRSIFMETGEADVQFTVSDDGVCRVECADFADNVYKIDVENGALHIRETDEREWYQLIRLFSFGQTYVRVCLPQTQYAALHLEGDTADVEIPNNFSFDSIDIETDTGDISIFSSVSGRMRIETDTGDIRVEGISADALELTVTTGRTTVTDVACRSLKSGGDTGDLFLDHVIASETFLIGRSTGDVTFEACDAAEIFVRTDTGDVTGSLCSDKVFFAQTDTGDIDVPHSETGGKCEMITDTGDIRIRIA